MSVWSVGVGDRLTECTARDCREDALRAGTFVGWRLRDGTTKMRCRLGVSPSPVGASGPVIATLCTPELAAKVCHTSSAPGGGFLTNVTPSACGPALIGSFRSIVAVAGTSLMRSPSREISISSPCRFAAARPIAAPLTRILNEYSGIEREGVLDQRAATRSERQPVEVIRLREITGHAIRRRRGREQQVADGEAAHLHGRGRVSLDQRRRHAQRIGDVVETLARIVRRQQRRRVDVEMEQIANRVGVLRPVHPMQKMTARIRRERRCAIELRLEARGKAVQRRSLGARHAGWRHQPCANLPHDLLEDIGMIAGLRRIKSGKTQIARQRPRVVTGDAVLVDQRLFCGRLRLRGCLRFERHRA